MDWRKKAKEMDTTGFKLWYTKKVRGKNGEGVMMDKVWKESVVDEKNWRQNLSLKINGGTRDFQCHQLIKVEAQDRRLISFW